MGQQPSSDLPNSNQRNGTITNSAAVRQYNQSNRDRKSGRPSGSHQSWPKIYQVSSRNDLPSNRNMRGLIQSPRPVQFHQTHGSNIKLSTDGKTATRQGSFCNAVVFSSRAIKINEPFTIQLQQSTQKGWSGVIRFGYTCHNPDRMRRNNLPKYVCPDLTVKPGNWAKALRESSAKHGDMLSFYVNEEGDVFSCLNQEGFVPFFSNVDASKPLWVLIDVYGNTTGVKIIDNYAVPPAVPVTTTPLRDSVPPPLPPARPIPTSESLPSISVHAQPSQRSRSPLEPTNQPAPLPFHNIHGHNIILRDNNLTAERRMDSYCGGLVFTSKPLLLGHEFILEVPQKNERYIGHLGVGLTSCDPSNLHEDDIPKEADALLDRLEYWVMSREFEVPECGQAFGFALNSIGELHIVDSNGQSKSIVMHVDTSIPLWLFLDVYGSTQSIQCKGLKIHSPHVFANAASPGASSLAIAEPPPNIETLQMDACTSNKDNENESKKQAKQNKKAPKRPTNPPAVKKPTNGPKQESEECKICMECPIEVAFYKCGHHCCCKECGNKLKGKNCPICRKKIDDVIMIFTS